MKVAVVVPVYNVEPYLNEFMDSLCRQTFQDFHIIAVDDHSTDRSAEILRSYEGFFGDRLQIIYNEKNLGPGDARNVGIEKISGKDEYVSFLDADDCLADDYFEKMVSSSDSYHVDITICGCDRFDSQTGKKTKGEMISNPEKVVSDISACKELAYINTFVWNKLFRKETIQDTRFPSMRRWEEFIFLFRILSKVGKVKFVNEILYHYRIREGSLTGGITEEMYESALSGLQREICEFRNGTEKYGRIKEQFEVQVFMRCGLGGTSRMSFKNMKKAGFYVGEMRDYLDSTIPEWHRNRYLRFRGCMHRGFKENAVMAAALLYRCHLFLLFIWVYWFALNILRKDIRW